MHAKFLKVFSILVLTSATLFFSACIDKDDDPDPGPTEEAGTILWTWETDGDVGIVSQPALGDDGTVYVAAGGGTVTWVPTRVFAINPDSSEKWVSEDLDHAGASSNIVVGSDGTVYVIGFLTLYAINPDNGQFKWTWEAPDSYHTQIGWLAIGEDHMIYCANIAAGSYVRSLFAVKEGVTQWRRDRESIYGASHPIIGPNGNLYVYWRHQITGNHHIDSYNPTTGQLRWASEPLEAGLYSATSMVFNESGNLLVSIHNPYKVLEIDPADGSTISVSEQQLNLMSICPNTDIYTYIGNSGLQCFTGSISENWMVENGVSGSHGVAVDVDNRAYVNGWTGSFGGNIQCWNNDGTLNWATAAASGAHAPLIDDDHRIYVAGGVFPGYLTCIQGDRPLAQSAWPRPDHDNKNTRNYNLW